MASLVLALLAPAERARGDDRVDRLARQMLAADDDRVRLSAALNLARTGEKRAIPAFVRALDDSDESVRGVAATALGRLVDEDSPQNHRVRVVRALRPLGQNDPESLVRQRARRSVRAIRSLPEPRADKPEIYVDLGTVSDESGAGLRGAVRDAVGAGINGESREMATEWPGGNPSAAELEESGAHAFHVDGTITSVSANDAGRNASISCEVSMVLATYPDKSMFGFLDGGAEVTTGSTESQIERGKRDCVVAVAENLVSSRVIPTIEERAR